MSLISSLLNINSSEGSGDGTTYSVAFTAGTSTITHSLNSTVVGVIVIDNSGNVLTAPGITYIDANSFTLTVGVNGTVYVKDLGF